MKKTYVSISVAMIFVVGWALAGAPIGAQSSSPIQVLVSPEGITIRNVGSKGILACEGKLLYEIPGVAGEHVAQWRQLFQRTLKPMGDDFAPGKELRFPPTTLPDDASQRYIYRGATVTGVVFSDGSVWGETGATLRVGVGIKAAEMSARLTRVSRAFEGQPLETLVKALKGPGPLVAGEQYGALVHRMLARELLDEQGTIRSDAFARLRAMITYLEQLNRQLNVPVQSAR
jgi:hypothetical protein